MPGTWDATIKLVYAADNGTSIVANTVNSGDPFSVIADVEIGSRLNEVVTRHDLFVAVHNVSRAEVLDRVTYGVALMPKANMARSEQISVNVPGGWGAKADEGDVLEIVASYKVSAGVNTDVSSMRSPAFVVTA